MQPKNTAEEIFAIVGTALSELNLEFRPVPEASLYVLGITGASFKFDVFVGCAEEFVTVMARLPFVIRPERIVDTIVYCNELNREIPVGNFEYLDKAACVGVKVGLGVKTYDPPLDAIKEAFFRAVRLAEEYSQKLYAVVNKN